MVNILLLIALLSVTPSCVTEKRCAELFPPSIEKKDSVSVVVKETLRDTTIIVPADSSWLQMLIECNEDGEAMIKQLISYENGSRVQLPGVSLKNNILTAECKVDSLKVYAILKDRDTSRTTISKEKETVQVTVNYLTWWQKTQLILFKVFAGVIFIYLLFRNIIKKSL
jgi:hypothetical protein